MLAAEKIFPQKIAGAEQAGQEGIRLFVANDVQGVALLRSAGFFHDESRNDRTLPGPWRVRRPGQGMGELLDQHGGKPQLLLIGGVGQLLAVTIPDKNRSWSFPSSISNCALET